MKRFAEEEIGVEFKFDPLVNPRIDCSQGPLAVRLSPEQAVDLGISGSRPKAEYLKLAQDELASQHVPGSQEIHLRRRQNGCASTPAAA